MKTKNRRTGIMVFFICLFLLMAVAPTFAIELKVGIILPGAVTDYGWDYAPVLALNELEADYPKVLKGHRYAEIVSPADAEGVIMDLVASGYNWIWGWGFQYKEACYAVAKKVDNVYFTISEGVPADVLPGRIDVIDDLPENTSYLAGIVGGAMSKTGKVGGVHGMANVILERAEAGFEAGAKAYNPRIRYRQIYVGAWGDPEGGKRAAEALFKTGVDVLLCIGDGTSLGVIEAVKQARAQGKDVHYIGFYVDQSILATGNVLTSVIYDYSKPFEQQLEDILNGRFASGKYYSLELGKGMYLAPFYNFDNQVPQKAKDMIEAAQADILSGKLKVPYKLKK